ncbi:coactosin-like protein [Haliotis cracherodii]|uniref:coactosin-like protein n=1 Tax=Haliotis rufescens TaxID=6454 RepID=UPI001EB0A996|nr:coactosin-like protein [Haliotis rufescens]XP_048253625.1 coactosin-like protein [Haliotis rufescens]XP_048253626.1 coactosin-like protein [Haliotis rufescens]
MSTKLDKDDVRAAYEDVRDDTSATLWAVFKYEGNTIQKSAIGNDYDEFQSQFGDEERAFGFIRITTGDELSKRSKFALVTWAGSHLSALKRARLSTDKSLIKQVIQNFAVEIMTSEQDEIKIEYITDEVKKAGGANYGTGK